MTILAQSVQLGFRIAIVWIARFLLAVAVNALLPGKVRPRLTGTETTSMAPFNRIRFWTCLPAALIAIAQVVLRAMLADIGWPSFI